MQSGKQREPARNIEQWSHPLFAKIKDAAAFRQRAQSMIVV